MLAFRIFEIAIQNACQFHELLRSAVFETIGVTLKDWSKSSSLAAPVPAASQDLSMFILSLSFLRQPNDSPYETRHCTKRLA